jgi:hypothetical protein
MKKEDYIIKKQYATQLDYTDRSAVHHSFKWSSSNPIKYKRTMNTNSMLRYLNRKIQ